MSLPTPGVPFEIIDFDQIAAVPCPCGTARRGFADVLDFPATIHVTEISLEARLHYHKTLTETYYFLECGADARMQLDDQLIPVHAGMCILIRPGVRHRALGRMRVLIVVLPKFDPLDEWFDEPASQPVSSLSRDQAAQLTGREKLQ
jgi:mannose-6-phosphate isomerase-like protein (cupin superfamily)